MLLHHARRPARTRPDGSLVTLAEQDRSRWDTRLIAEGVQVLQAALARDRLGEFQAQAAIAALHADAQSAAETDWLMPEAICVVAAETRSAIFCCRAKVRARLRWMSACAEARLPCAMLAASSGRAC